MTFTKDPNSRLDYEVNWSAWLGDDTIVTSIWVDVAAGITVDSSSHTDTVTKVWISGGTHGTNCQLTNRITTAGGRTDDRTVAIYIRER